MARTKTRVPLPDDFINLSNEMIQMKDDFDELKDAYVEQIIHLLNGGFNLTQIAEIGPFPYASLRNWTLRDEESV